MQNFNVDSVQTYFSFSYAFQMQIMFYYLMNLDGLNITLWAAIHTHDNRRQFKTENEAIQMIPNNF